MATAAPHAKPGARKALDAELNLVPFIDLLSCLISFLLITAVWTRVSALPAQSTGSLAQQATDASEPVPVRLAMSATGYTLTVASVVHAYPRVALSELTAELKAVKQRFPSQRRVTMTAEDTVAFTDLAATMDQVQAAWQPEGADITLTSD